MAEYKKTGRLKALIVTGCLAQRYQKEILDEIPEVDGVLGTTSYDKILEAIDEALAGHTELKMEDINALPQVETKRLVTTGGHYAYLKIAEGCDKHCTYCIIPKVRGDYRSVPDGETSERSKRTGRRRSKRADPGRTGNHRLRSGSLRGKEITGTAAINCARSRDFTGSGFSTVIRKRLQRN